MMKYEKSFTHRTPIQLRFKDIDKFNHVNNANHLTFFELARISYFDEVLGKDINWEEQGVILARITVDYVAPILGNHNVAVYTKFTGSKNKSFTLEHIIVHESGDNRELLAKASSVLVSYNYVNNSSIVFPEKWKSLIEHHEANCKVV